MTKRAYPRFAITSRRIAMRTTMRLSLTATTAALALWTGAQAGGDKGAGHSDKDHIVVRPTEVKWGPAPPSLPAGAKAAVLVGDPSKPAPYVLRVQFPDGYKVP